MKQSYSHDEAILAQLGYTMQDIEQDVACIENEDIDDALDGYYYQGSHITQADGECMVTVSVRMPKSALEKLSHAARRLNLSRSEYMRRRLTGCMSD